MIKGRTSMTQETLAPQRRVSPAPPTVRFPYRHDEHVTPEECRVCRNVLFKMAVGPPLPPRSGPSPPRGVFVKDLQAGRNDHDARFDYRAVRARRSAPPFSTASRDPHPSVLPFCRLDIVVCIHHHSRLHREAPGTPRTPQVSAGISMRRTSCSPYRFQHPNVARPWHGPVPAG